MKIFELLEDRKLGPSLKDQGYDLEYVVIYRAVPANIDSFKSKDYVTRSRKFAKEHADHVSAVEDEPAHVLKAMVKASDVYDAYNPGEYFYDGPEKKGKIIYKADPYGNLEEDEEKLTGPHANREFELMITGEKPAAIISHDSDDVKKFQPYVEDGTFVTRKIYILGPPGRRFLDYGYAQKGEGWRLDRIQEIYDEVTETGRMTREHHRELGQLLGYSKKAIDHFVNRQTKESVINEELNWAVGSNSDKARGAIKNDMKSPDYTLIWANIEDLFKHTESFQKLDINDPRGGENSIGDRVSMAKEFWAKGGHMNPALIAWNDYYNKINFGDGRHRLVAAYQLGEKWAPVVVDNESLPKITELVRTK